MTTVVQRGFSRTLSTKVLLPTDEVDSVQQLVAGLRATAAMWVADERFACSRPTRALR